MKIEIKPRQSGKTTKMIDWLSNYKERILITFSHDEECRLKNLYPEVGNRIMCFDCYNLKNKCAGNYDFEIGIDNADMILQSFFKQRIRIITCSNEKDKGRK